MSSFKKAFVAAGVVTSQLTGTETVQNAATMSAQAYDAIKIKAQDAATKVKKALIG